MMREVEELVAAKLASKDLQKWRSENVVNNTTFQEQYGWMSPANRE
jgi:hypothetical protein